MKKILFTSIACLLAYVSQAQDGGLSFGIKAGVHQSFLYGSDINKFSDAKKPSKQSSFTVGLAINNKMSKHFWLKHEMFYVQRNMNLHLTQENAPAFVSAFKRGYLDIYPASLTFQVIGFQIYAGPYLGVLLHSSQKNADGTNGFGAYGDPKAEPGEDDVTARHIQKIDAGFVAGFEYEVKPGINIGIRYVHGFVPIAEMADIDKSQWNIYNQSVSLTLGFSLQGKR